MKKRLLSLLLALCLVMALVPMTAFAEENEQSSKTSITTVDELLQFAKAVDNGEYDDKTDAVVSLDADLVSWRKALQEENKEWEQLVVQSSNDIKTVMDQYNMIGIPYTLLLDKNGYVLFVNLQGYSLESWLDNYSKIRK